MKFETMRIHFMFAVCFLSRNLLPWQLEVTTSPLYLTQFYQFNSLNGNGTFSFSNSNGTYCITPPSCGAKFPGYLDGDHPADLKVGESVKRTVCFSNGQNCCVRRQEIEILKCKDFFIYKLPKAPFRRARYCGNKGKMPGNF